MPLSEEELRLLEQMEQALAQEDPKFVSTLRGSSLERVARIRTIAAAGFFVLGIVMLMGGAISAQIWLGVLGFVVMLASATIGLAAWRGRHAPTQQPQRSGEDQLFDFDDHPHRFDVIEGGRPEPAQEDAPPQGQAGPQARQQGPQAGHLHAAHGAALGAAPQPGLLSSRSTPQSLPAPAQQRHRPDPAPPATLALHAADDRLAPQAHGLDRAERTSGSRRRPRPARRSDPAPPGPAVPRAT